jgi:hypothetical protein
MIMVVCLHCGVPQGLDEYRMRANGHMTWRDNVCKVCRGEEVKIRKRKRQVERRVVPLFKNVYQEGNYKVMVLPPSAGF